jgi:hypothetical protein
MPPILSPADLAERTSRAVAAAASAGRALGLPVSDPVVLHDTFSLVVHLAPAPVVVRVPTVLPTGLRSDLEAQAARQRRELDVVTWLAGQDQPVVPPSPLVPCEPVQRDGFSMTFWQFVRQDSDIEPDYVLGSAHTATLHAALRHYPGELPFLSPLASVPAALTELESQPDLVESADVDRARQEWALLEPVLATAADFASAFPAVRPQPVHGDSPPFNMIPTPEGALHSDFEDVTLGPPEWDLTLVGPDGGAAYDTAAAGFGLPKLDRQVLHVMESARMLQVVACLALVPQLPMLADGLLPALEQWRTMPLAGGLG